MSEPPEVGGDRSHSRRVHPSGALEASGSTVSSRIGFLVDFRLVRRGDALFCDDPFLLFALGFRAWYDEITLIARCFDEHSDIEPKYPVPTDGVRVVTLPPYPSIDSLYVTPWRYWPCIERALAATIPELRALWLNFGHPVSHRALAHLDRAPGVRAFATLRGAYDRDARLRGRGPSLARRVAGLVMSFQMRAFARRASRRRIPCIGFGTAGRLRGWGISALDMVSSLLTEADLALEPTPDPNLACDVISVGRLAPEKGFDVLIEAILRMKSAATLRIVGSGEERRRLEHQVAARGLQHRIVFDGHVAFGPALFARYASARVLAIPSHTEGVPKAAYEAMAFGLPVVATAVGGLPDAVGCDGERGWLVPAGDPAALARALDDALADPAMLAGRGARARSFARDTTLERQVRKIVEFVDPDRLADPCRNEGA